MCSRNSQHVCGAGVRNYDSKFFIVTGCTRRALDAGWAPIFRGSTNLTFLVTKPISISNHLRNLKQQFSDATRLSTRYFVAQTPMVDNVLFASSQKHDSPSSFRILFDRSFPVLFEKEEKYSTANYCACNWCMVGFFPV